MADITKSKSYRLVRDIGSTVFVVRGVIVLFFLATTFIFAKLQDIRYIQHIAAIVVFLSAIVLYAWGGWKTVRSGYSLLDSVKLGFIIGILVGLWAEIVIGKFSVIDLVGEAVLGSVSTFLGALITKKFKLANAAR